jgi:hypothetical protein
MSNLNFLQNLFYRQLKLKLRGEFPLNRIILAEWFSGPDAWATVFQILRLTEGGAQKLPYGLTPRPQAPKFVHTEYKNKTKIKFHENLINREARAKVIAAEGEMKSARALKEAADVMCESPAALQLRYLQVRIQRNKVKN